MSILPGTRLGAYEVLSLLGAGGMGEVYKAVDRRLDRTVAIKVLPAHLATDPLFRERFDREARIISQLDHPHICALYDVGECPNPESRTPSPEPIQFLVMQYLEGETLAARLEKGRLPLDQALQYAIEMASALDTAHRAGIVHRDLKPGNVMLTKSGVKLLDFGLAKSGAPIAAGPELSRLPTAPPTLTAQGSILGTLQYIAPEQLEAKEADARADIWAFGAVLYEMLTGQRAFEAVSTASVITAILRDEPRPMRQYAQEIPHGLDEIVMRCLRKDPAARFQTMAAVKAALQKVRLTKTEPGPAPSIAVLPFTNLSADQENEYFSDGLAEEIINALAKIPGVRVIARTSAFAYRGKEYKIRQIGEELRVSTLLEGSVRRVGSRVRITAQLINVADESHIWSERYDREMTDIFALQDDISQAIADVLKVKLGAPVRRAENLAAYDAYWRGRYHLFKLTTESMAKSRQCFEEALNQDSTFAPAYEGLAVYYYGLAAMAMRKPGEVLPLAKSAAERALSIDPTLAEAHSVLGVFATVFEYDWTLAAREFDMALSAEAVVPSVRFHYANFFLLPLRRFDQAITQYRQALDTDPLAIICHFGLALTLYVAGKYDAAIERCRKALEIDPNSDVILLVLGMAQLENGLIDDSIATLQRTLELEPRMSYTPGFLANAHARAGRRSQAEQVMREAQEKSQFVYFTPLSHVYFHLGLGEINETFQWLDKAFEDRDPYLPRMLADDALVGPLRTDRRFDTLLRKMNLG